MNEATTKLLEQLAAKLGTSVELVWSVLVKQGVNEAWMSVCYVAFTLFFIVLILPFSVSAMFNKDEDKRIIGCAASCLGVVICFIVIAGNIENLIIGFMNPEYFAITKLLEVMK